jgi:hypothetical protein
MNVEDLAASRWKPIRQAREEIAKAQGAHARSSARLEELRGQVGPAERRDRKALGRALVDGKNEPASEAALLAAEIEREERRLEALAVAVEAAHGQIAKVVDGNRGDWRRQAMQEPSRAQRRYTAVIEDLAVAREELNYPDVLGRVRAVHTAVIPSGLQVPVSRGSDPVWALRLYMLVTPRTPPACGDWLIERALGASGGLSVTDETYRR